MVSRCTLLFLCTRGGVKSGYSSHTKLALFVSRITPVLEYSTLHVLILVNCDRNSARVNADIGANLGSVRQGVINEMCYGLRTLALNRY